MIFDANLILSLDLKGNKLIEASAGTGKTYAISNLFCRFVIEGYEVSKILLVTFTNAATDELKNKIRNRLKLVFDVLSSKSKSPPDNDQFVAVLLKQFESLSSAQQDAMINRLHLALRCFDESAIYTIDGFCQRTLTEFAFNSGQAFDLELITHDDDLWYQVILDWWRRQSYELSSEQYSLFTSSLKSFNQVLQSLKDIRKTPCPNFVPPINCSIAEVYEQWNDLQLQLKQFKEQYIDQKNEIESLFKRTEIFDKRSVFKAEKIAATLKMINQQLMLNQGDTDTYFPESSLGILSNSFIQKKIVAKFKDLKPEYEIPFFLKAEELLIGMKQCVSKFTQAGLMDAYDYAEIEVNKRQQKSQSISFDQQLKRLHHAITKGNNCIGLLSALRQQYPVAMIDEFQDTNVFQYEIFKSIYQNQSQLSLLMIGDPKQAIYSFRGGDIFTYIKAKQDVGTEVYSLNENWRSCPDLIQALNTLFSNREDAFIYSDFMKFEGVLAAKKSQQALIIKQDQQPALTIWHLTNNETKNKASGIINNQVANEISKLINLGLKDKAHINNEAVKAADIAVLVRSHFEASQIALELKNRGVNSIKISREKVLQSAAAKGLYTLMKGIAYSDDINAIRAMFSSELIDFSAHDIQMLLEDNDAFLSWVLQVKALTKIWFQEGFIVMFNSLLQTLNVAQKIATFEYAERELSNVLHCAEIIQLKSHQIASPVALCEWLSKHVNQHQAVANEFSDEQELRLESEEAQVKIVTVHKSKGLEYPIVFVPYLWGSKLTPKTDAKSLNFYQYNDQDLNYQSVADFSKSSNARELADKQRLAEDMRLLYVAMTRAKNACYLVTGHAKSSGSEHSALSYLLNSAKSIDDLKSLQDLSSYSISIKALSELAQPEVLQASHEKVDKLKANKFTGIIHNNWHISSFTRMTRDIHQTPHGGSQLTTDDAIFNFEKGSEVGTFIHHILEDLDFCSELKPQINLSIELYAARYNQANCDQTVLHQWIDEIVNAPLNESNLSLSKLKKSQRLDELEFNFSIKGVDIKSVNRFLFDRTQQQSSSLSIANFKGMINGFIDLVFEYDGKFYIADYKTNFLGNDLEDYNPQQLEQAVIDRRYDLQYLIYSLALHRYLKIRIKNYQYQTHFGGVYYLFLRAMRKNTGHHYGVHFDLPSFDEIEFLDTQIFGTEIIEEIA